MNKKNKFVSLTGFHLKYIAMLTMTIDHIGAVLLPRISPYYNLFRGIGRIAFPIYCYLLVEGFIHTSNRKSYLTRLLLFAMISEIPFDMALFHFPLNHSLSFLMSHQNVFFTLSSAFLAMCLFEKYWFTQPLMSFSWLFIIGFTAEWFHFDYGLTGILVVMIIFICKRLRTDFPPLLTGILTILPLISFESLTGFCPALAVPFLWLYNEKKGSPLPGGRSFPGAKYLFYAYYPLHLTILGILWFFYN